MKTALLVLVVAAVGQVKESPPDEKPAGKGFIGARVQVNIENNMAMGIAVIEVVKDGPAEKAGLMANDVILKIDDKPTIDLNSFKDIVLSHKPGDEVIIHFTRDGKEAEFRLTIGERPT